eukprot:CAMPEP_0114601224 /NCGR_PEP_ID=MMETSP0125-20121206/23854_1 /TAXON_ID=485358 ORGANISM="Aristerostoma sp., Strain ATCC 50986" /NCGR_SAMPLE_ID=MMETSP0125 /ASSEMBLY_ACC=CAM_ASM_000245 /LENGTH=42 /DNA_ID= /DNA_START= /DNA_END= /DNA_ORIENTATION=
MSLRDIPTSKEVRALDSDLKTKCKELNLMLDLVSPKLTVYGE